MTLNNRREGIIPITHTEIMLVLAVVLLLLLVASNTNWSARFAQAEENIAELTERAELSPETLAEEQRQLDLGREVKDALVRGGVAPAEEQAALSPEDVTAVAKSLEDNTRADQALAAVEEAINNARSESDRHDEEHSDIASRAQRIEQIVADARIGEMVRRIMEGPDQELVGESASNEEFERRVRRLLGSAATESTTVDNTGDGDLVGFNPCWPGDATRDNRRYYFAYDLTYIDNRYHIEPHLDWNQRIPVIVAALSGELAILRDYPTEAVSPEALVTFGTSVEQALAPLRETESGNNYPSDCRLAVTLNAEAPLSVAEFVSVNVGLYPVIR